MYVYQETKYNVNIIYIQSTYNEGEKEDES